MPLYTYKAKDKKGKVVSDVLQAANRQEAASILKSGELQVLTIKKASRGLDIAIGGGVSVAEKATFCRFLATMLRAGLPLPEALSIIKDEAKNKKLKKIIYDVSFQVRKGNTMSSVLSKYKDVFDPVFLTMVKAGEESGTLDKSFDYLSKQLMNSHELTQKVKGAMMYPAVIVVAMMANFVVMLVFVLPKISQVFTQLNVDLPKTTEIMLRFGNFVGDNTLAVFVTIVIALLLCVLLFVVNSTRQIIMNLFLRLPAVKSVTTQLDIARFTGTLSTLLRSGVPIMVALDVSSDMIKQPFAKKRSKDFSKGVASGQSLSDILTKGKNIFPSTVVQTIKAGEKTGSLEEVLEEMADFYQREVDYNLKKLTSLIEPVLMIVIGLAVGAMVVMMITPIYNLVGGIESQF